MNVVDEILSGLASGDRRSLAKAITLVEGETENQRAQARVLLEQLEPAESIRLGISGVPGVGKSTFIESFGLGLIDKGHRVAVLAVDPSSPLSGGSIMGDRTRMPKLSANNNAFIRPSPAGGQVGGVARRTREALLLCEAAGYDDIILETVGVGQGEYLAASMVDAFIMLHLPGSGDDLQGMKKGILELADLVLVTKSDGEQKSAAILAREQLKQSLHFSNTAAPNVLNVSCVTGDGLEEVYTQVSRLIKDAKETGDFAKKRNRQSLNWLRAEVDRLLQEWAFSQKSFQDAYAKESEEVGQGKVPASVAAFRMISRVLKSRQ